LRGRSERLSGSCPYFRTNSNTPNPTATPQTPQQPTCFGSQLDRLHRVGQLHTLFQEHERHVYIRVRVRQHARHRHLLRALARLEVVKGRREGPHDQLVALCRAAVARGQHHVLAQQAGAAAGGARVPHVEADLVLHPVVETVGVDGIAWVRVCGPDQRQGYHPPQSAQPTDSCSSAGVNVTLNKKYAPSHGRLQTAHDHRVDAPTSRRRCY